MTTLREDTKATILGTLDAARESDDRQRRRWAVKIVDGINDSILQVGLLVWAVHVAAQSWTAYPFRDFIYTTGAIAFLAGAALFGLKKHGWFPNWLPNSLLIGICYRGATLAILWKVTFGTFY